MGAGATKMGHLGLVVRGQASSGLGWGALGWGALPGGGGEGRGGGGDRLQLVNTNTCLVSSVTLHHPPSSTLYPPNPPPCRSAVLEGVVR